MSTQTKELKADKVVDNTAKVNEMSTEELMNQLAEMPEPSALEIALGRGAAFQDIMVICTAAYGNTEEVHRSILRKIGMNLYKRAAITGKLPELLVKEEHTLDSKIDSTYNSASLRDKMYDLRRQMRGIR